MSYCRWSSDRNQCDLYCYEDVHGGWTTHVAGRRREPIPDDVLDPVSPEAAERFDFASAKQWTDDQKAAWQTAYDAWNDALDAAEMHTLKSPHAGQSYSDPTLEAFRDRVVELSKDPELCVPDWLLPSIDEEIAEAQAIEPVSER